MVRLIARVAAVSSVLGIVAFPASAQLSGNPVYASNMGAVASVSADFGGGVNAESGKGRYIGGRLAVGVSAISFWVGAGHYDGRNPSVDDEEIALGGGLAVDVFSSSSTPLSAGLQAGAGTIKCGVDCTILDGVAGPAFKANISASSLVVEPWILPRLHVSRMSFGAESVVQTGFGVSGGINLDLVSGLGLHAALDYVALPRATSGTLVARELSPLTAGVGLHYRFAR